VAMLSAYVGGAVDGWTHVTADGAPAGPAGGAGAFAADAAALGRSLGRVHRALAGAFGTGPAPRAGDRPADGLRRRLGERLERAIAGTDELRPFAARLRRRVDRLGLGGPPLQRVHGDLHLGQVLRGPAGWHLIDFEGEPGRPAPECRRLDSPLRDVAGMLRSLDYAAAFVAGVPPTGPAEAYDAWSAGSAEALCLGYAEVTGTDPRSQPELLAAYLLDKLVYEVAYEARHRPGWLPVPMRALRRMFPAA
jgi:maltokinase